MIDIIVKAARVVVSVHGLTESDRAPLVRTHLDHYRHVRAARPIGVRVLVGIGRISSSRCSATLATAVRHLTALPLRFFLFLLSGSAVALCQSVNAYLNKKAQSVTCAWATMFLNNRFQYLAG